MLETGSARSSREWVTRKFPDHAQWPRVKRLLHLGGMVCVLHGVAWGAYYGSHGMLVLACVLSALTLVGIACFIIARRRDRLPMVLIAHVLLVMTIFVSLAETPTLAAARSTHLFLLPIGAATFFLFRSEGLYLRWILPTLCVVALAWLAISPASLGAGLELLSDTVRRVRHGLNTVTAMALTVGVLAIFREDFSTQMDQYAALVRGIAQRELRGYLQPQVALNGQVVGAELLLRWDRPGHGLQSPANFIPLAEQTGLIHEIGLMALRRACVQLAAWATLPGVDTWVLSVNVSPLQLASDSFVNDVRGIVRGTGAPANRLRLEITESALAHDHAQIAATMNALREDGVSWSLDDFGTGFSSLSLLQVLPLDELKIDQTFVSGMGGDASHRELVRKIIEIAAILGVSTVAEGVETEQQRAWLASMGCRVFQGYLFGRPVPADDFHAAHVAPLV
ncbi:EAL domain-containing protein [Stenotrophomonas pennii]|uniref:putative bifunctional diguanylate cyclase/phosphodiesterase n=1 Tax=Stenotrophomonas lacuserhaii TaxID=2760084 RepID=UPI003209C005